ncbi:hypothetical protein [Xylanimonas ulmi]|uniref:Uncharacterized protein n=1 Tax=Xylanimonas ulmi TaxID=228973 RepID=A0A4V2EXT8_9MICO|nr:hypothetical protein [Xylanibacterium ulmi]RZS60640.1 hypothetical protein EV386_0910 [Xylanibacterium ulmi]
MELPTRTFGVEHYTAYVTARSALRALDLGAPSTRVAWAYRDVVRLLDDLHTDEGLCHVEDLDAPRPALVEAARAAISRLVTFGKPPDDVAVVVTGLDAAVALEASERGAR